MIYALTAVPYRNRSHSIIKLGSISLLLKEMKTSDFH